jgi:hypothetical protein
VVNGIWRRGKPAEFSVSFNCMAQTLRFMASSTMFLSHYERLVNSDDSEVDDK